MKVGDLVMRDNYLRQSVGPGIVINTCKNEDNTIFHEIQWFNDDADCFWYTVPELEVINESR